MRLKPSNRILRLLQSEVDHSGGPEERFACVVFAPHPDDEVLGCGGTIIRKRMAGTPVSVVFMTDGRTSHQRFINPAQLCRIRRDEAIAACREMGVEAGSVHFLDFPDGQLGEHEEPAMAEVRSLLAATPAAEVFVPYRADRTADHEATFRIVSKAIQGVGSAFRMFEYPVWAWNQWPWVSLDLKLGRTLIRSIGVLCRSLFGRTMLSEFRSGTFIGEVLHQKRKALACHRSQTIELQPGVGWPTLESVADGEFLKCFFRDYEVFRCSDLGPMLDTETSHPLSGARTAGGMSGSPRKPHSKRKLSSQVEA